MGNAVFNQKLGTTLVSSVEANMIGIVKAIRDYFIALVVDMFHHQPYILIGLPLFILILTGLWFWYHFLR